MDTATSTATNTATNLANDKAQAPPARRTLTGLLASLALCVLLPSLGTSSANIALPALVEALGAPMQQVQWVVLAYLLASTGLMVGVGRLADMLGHRRLLLAGVLLFTAASALCGLGAGLWPLVAARAAQGLGAAAMLALATSLVSAAVPKARAGRAMGLLGSMSALGTALGPALGGLLIAALGWRAIFLVNLPLGLLALGLAWRYLPAERAVPDSARPRFSTLATLLLAALLLALGLAAYALAMTLGRGSFGALNLALLGAAALVLTLFLLLEAQSATALIPWASLRAPRLRAGLAMTALVSTVMMATLVAGPFYLAQTLGLDMARTGMVMAVGPVVAAFSGVPAGRWVDRLGAARMSVYGLAAMLAGCLALSMVAAAAPLALALAGYLGPIVVITAGYALFQAANNSALMSELAPQQRGVISGLLNLARNLGLITGASALGALFAVAGMRITFVAAAALLLLALLLAPRRRQAN